MRPTPNRTHLMLGLAMILFGLSLMGVAFMNQGRHYGRFAVGALGPMGLLMAIGGAALVFSSPKSK